MLGSMSHRSGLFWALVPALLLGAAPARGDVAIAGTHIIPSDAVFTGTRDFPGYRFVVAVHTSRPGKDEMPSIPIPPPAPVREGEPVSTHTVYFQELRAIPADMPDPVSDEWVLASKAPTSGSFSRHPVRVADGSNERSARAYYHIRQVRAGWISLELLGADLLLDDGSKKPHVKVIPQSYSIESFEAPAGWQLFVMPDPKWAPSDSPLPAVAVGAGDTLPLSPGPRTLVAVFGGLGPDGSLTGKEYQTWGRPIDPFWREEVEVGSGAVLQQRQLNVRISPGGTMEMSFGERFKDADGDWFDDSELTFPVDQILRPEQKIALGVAASVLVAFIAGAVWLFRRRKRKAKAA